jgi:transposase
MMNGLNKGASKERGEARVVRPNRVQLTWDLIDPDAWLPTDHMARLVWAFVAALDLTRLYDKVKAREGEPGRPAADPAVQLALWLLATIEGIGSARALDRLSERDLAYRWLSCGVPVNYHGLADFRVTHADVLDELLTQSLASFIAEGFIDLEEIIVDGTKVKASAGKSSFKRAVRLDEAVAAAKTRVETLKAEVDAAPAANSKRREAARLRAARETEERAAKAKETLVAIEKERQKRAKRSPKEMAKKKEPRASLTDPEARRMRFADGAIRSAYNVQLAVTSDHGFITAVQATDRRNDNGLARPMLEETERRTGACVKRLLADAGYASIKDIAELGSRTHGAVTVYVPQPEEKEEIKPENLAARQKKRAEEPEAVKKWRARMATSEAEVVMQRRGRIERINAQSKNRGLGTMLVRGLKKVQAVALLHSLAHNLATALRLRAAGGASLVAA